MPRKKTVSNTSGLSTPSVDFRVAVTAVARYPSDIVRSWAIQLATEEAGKSKLSSETLLKLAQTDPSPTVRLALASALPKSGCEDGLGGRLGAGDAWRGQG
jgi:hypothetical protein